jgi:hypothetical protein
MLFCIVNCKEDYNHLKLACKPIFQKINTLYEQASIEVEGKHFDLDILQLVLGLGGSVWKYSCPWYRPFYCFLSSRIYTDFVLGI